MRALANQQGTSLLVVPSDLKTTEPSAGVGFMKLLAKGQTSRQVEPGSVARANARPKKRRAKGKANVSLCRSC